MNIKNSWEKEGNFEILRNHVRRGELAFDNF